MRSLRVLAILAVLTISGVNVAQAATISFNRAAFQAAVAGGTITQQDFDSFADGTLLIGNVGGVTYTSSTGTVIVTNDFLTSTPPNGIGRTGNGTGFDFFLASDIATFTFSSPQGAFGIDINTFANTDGAYTATLNTGDIATSRLDVFPGFGTGNFIGFISDTPFTSVSISANTGFAFTLDTLVFGPASAITPVPEPATLLLLATGLTVYAGRRLRKRGV